MWSLDDVKWLPDKDSNLDKKSQNLLCYHYTIGQCFYNVAGKIFCQAETLKNRCCVNLLLVIRGNNAKKPTKQ